MLSWHLNKKKESTDKSPSLIKDLDVTYLPFLQTFWLPFWELLSYLPFYRLFWLPFWELLRLLLFSRCFFFGFLSCGFESCFFFSYLLGTLFGCDGLVVLLYNDDFFTALNVRKAFGKFGLMVVRTALCDDAFGRSAVDDRKCFGK